MSIIEKWIGVNINYNFKELKRQKKIERQIFKYILLFQDRTYWNI